MNSVQIAQKVWSGFTNARYSPTDEEIEKAVRRAMYDEPEFVYDNTIRRLMGHFKALRSMLEYEPKSEREAHIRGMDICDLHERPFHEEYLLPDHEYFPEC